MYIKNNHYKSKQPKPAGDRLVEELLFKILPPCYSKRTQFSSDDVINARILATKTASLPPPFDRKERGRSRTQKMDIVDNVPGEYRSKFSHHFLATSRRTP